MIPARKAVTRSFVISYHFFFYWYDVRISDLFIILVERGRAEEGGGEGSQYQVNSLLTLPPIATTSTN